MWSCVTDLTMFRGKDSKRTLKLWDRKSLSVESSVGCSAGAWKIRTLRAARRMAWLVKFQREAKTPLGHLYEESVILVSWH